ncbi:MAG: glycosyltransferase [Armatimonadota bacterium]
MKDSRVRVVHVLPHAAAGGATLLAMELAQRLDRGRYQVKLAVGPESDGEGNLLEEMRRLGLELILLPHMRRAPHAGHDARALLELGRLLYHQRPHIVHTHGSKPKLLTSLAAAFGSVPLRVAHVWGWEWQPASNLLRRCAYRWEARMSAQGYDALIACSEAMRRQGLAQGVGRPRQYEVVLPSVDLERFNPNGRDRARTRVRAEFGLPVASPIVVSVMRLAEQKAPDILLGAAALLSALVPKLRWLIVGGGPLQAQVAAMVKNLHLQDTVILTGPRRDVPRLLKAADIFALASDWEPFGVAYLEASAVGLPVVGTRVDGTPEAVVHGETGLLVDRRNPMQLATAIARIATESHLARRLGRGGTRRAQQFGHERFVAGIEDIYARLLAENGGAGQPPEPSTLSHASS